MTNFTLRLLLVLATHQLFLCHGAPPFLSPRRAAARAYLKHLEDELKGTKDQLYRSQNTLNSLRKRGRESAADDILGKRKVNLLEDEIIDIKKKLQTSDDINQESTRKILAQDTELKMLELKLEAAQIALNQRNQITSQSLERRVSTLKNDLRLLRSNFSRRTGSSQDDMDAAILSVVTSTIKAIEEDWSSRYEAIEKKLRDQTEKSLQHAQMQEEGPGGRSTTSEEEMEQLRSRISQELKDDMTVELTEQLTEQIETRLRRRFRKQLKAEKSKLAAEADKASKHNSLEVKELEANYTRKLDEMKLQCDESIAAEKERMRQLVRALLQRETAQNRNTATQMESPRLDEEVIHSKASSRPRSSRRVMSVRRNP